MLQRLRPDIKADEYAALLEVKGLLAEGKIKVKMANSHDCIGGCMSRVMGFSNPMKYVGEGRSHALKELFFPTSGVYGQWVMGFDRVAPSWLVIRAIDRFLAYKRPWVLF